MYGYPIVRAVLCTGVRLQTFLGFGVFMLLGLLGARAQEAALVSPNEVWRYQKFPNGQKPSSREWIQRKFDDSAWRRARSGLELPDHEAGPAEPRPPQPGHFVMRKQFAAAHREQIHSLWLTVEHELGFVAYLNGVEIARNQGRGAKFPLATERAKGVEPKVFPVIVDISQYRDLIDDEENVLALEGASSGESESILPVSASVVINFPHGPMLMPTTNSVRIAWSTWSLPPGDSSVDYGLTPALGWTVSNSTPVVYHLIELTNLMPDTFYYYRVATFTRDALATSATNSFRTLRMSGPAEFVVVGDTGIGTTQQGQIAQVMRNLNPDLVLHAGDIIYGGFNELTAITRFFLYYRDQLRTTPFFLTAGNHDVGMEFGGMLDLNPTNFVLSATNFQNTFCLPTNNLTETEHFYSFDHGDVHFVCLFQPWIGFQSFLSQAQLPWLTNDLASSAKPWKVLFFHEPIESSGMYAYLSDGPGTQVINSLAEQYGVQIIFSGHDHNWQRFTPTNSVHYVVTGGGGGGGYSLTTLHPGSANFWNIGHCTRVRVAEDTMTVEAYDVNGTQIDRMVIHKSAPRDELYEATWNTPVVEDFSGSGANANIPGQTFDLKGTPILTKAGRSSNLGRVFINNDAQNLYIGFESPMFYSGNTILLFIQAPGLAGVTNLVGLGNGIVDPEGEGVDGLDFLENLSFADMRPGIACILGYEQGDGVFRSFSSNQVFNTGQGAFRLNSALMSLAGVHLQQFSQSPQLGIGTPDDDANFIELAVPLSELGGLLPGQEIKMAAVVGGSWDPVTQRCFFDTAGLATYQSGSGYDPVIISGVRVRLATMPYLDTDGDGLLDAWEIRYGLDPQSAEGRDGAEGDPDQDGMVNADEQIAATDPMDANSVLRLRLKVLSHRRYELSWSSVPNRRYQVEYADDQLTSYIDMSGPGWPRVAQSTNETVVENLMENATVPTQRTYRLRLVP